MTWNYLMGPAALLFLGGLGLLGLQIFKREKEEGGLLSVVVLLLSAITSLFGWLFPPLTSPVDGTLWFSTNPESAGVSAILCGLSTATILLSFGPRGRVSQSFYPWLLIATAGGIASVMAEHLLTLVLSLALLTFGTLNLVDGQARDENRRLAQSNTGNLLLAALLAIGLSSLLLYLATGLGELTAIYGFIRGLSPEQISSLAPQLLVSLVLFLAGMAIMMGVAPFHLWLPDVVEKSESAVGTYVLSTWKLAVTLCFVHVLEVVWTAPGFVAWGAGWPPVLGGLAIVSVFWGQLALLRQVWVKPLFGYSAVASSGFVLLGLFAANLESFAAVRLFSVTYALCIVGACAALFVLQTGDGEVGVDSLAGVGRRQPLLGVFFAGVLLSLAGLPLGLGYVSVTWLLQSVFVSGREPFAVAGAVALALGVYAYLRLVYYLFLHHRKQGHHSEPGHDRKQTHDRQDPDLAGGRTQSWGLLVLFVSFACALWFGLAPSGLLLWARAMGGG